ncbi:putative leucine-rich repeat domain superfamily [Plasmopara halstedii]
MQEIGTGAEVSVNSKQRAAKRLREVYEERKIWIVKREELLKRKTELLKLLQLQDYSNRNIEQDKPQQGLEKAKSSKEKDDEEIREKNVEDMARKKELRDLQVRAEAAQAVRTHSAVVIFLKCVFHSFLFQKQQAAATLLAHRLKQLLAKRKREDKETNGRPRKKTEVSSENVVKTQAFASEMHLFAPAPNLNVGTTELAKAACFRIMTRYLVQTGKMIPRPTLDQAFKTYTGKTLEELVDWSSLEHCLTPLVAGDKQDLSILARKPYVCWQPGRQSLKMPTFISSDSVRIQKMIKLEQDVVASMCESLKVVDQTISSAIRRRQQRLFFCALDNFVTTTSPAMLLSFFIMDTRKQTRVFYRSYTQFANILEKADIWLSEQAELSDSNSSLLPRFDGQTGFRDSRDRSMFSKYAKPFSVEKDSVARQLKGAAQHYFRSKTIDPMKVMCRYELNGVCYDKNCTNYHQRDYDSNDGPRNIVKEGFDEHNDDASCTVERMDDIDQLLMSFAVFRDKVMKKWPLISTIRTLSKTVIPINDGISIASGLHLSNDTDSAISTTDKSFENDNGDFIALDSQEELPCVGDARYFDEIGSRKLYGEVLQAKVNDDPTATDAWLQLAIFQLDLVIEMSDDAVKLSDDDYLRQQLIFLCKELNFKQHNSPLRIWAVEEANLKHSLHTLSRALEVEANAYCEALWLLYLHLCKQITSRQTEIDMVEQSVQFLPNSHALWLRYISTYDFESVSVAESIHWRLLEHIARAHSNEIGPETSRLTSKDVSILITAITFHLCIKLCHAGACSRVLRLLSALLQLDDQSQEFSWCNAVRDQMQHNEVILICIVLAHFLLFHEIPDLIEHWVAASNLECIPIEGLAYAAGSLRDRGCDFEVDVFSRALTCYELALHTFQIESNLVHNAGNVILSNWMLLLALQRDEKRNKSLSAFFDKHLATIQQFSGATCTAAKLMVSEMNTGHEAQQLMLTMMNKSSETRFPEALHHYLFTCHQLPVLADALSKTIPYVMERLADLLDVNIDDDYTSSIHDTSKLRESRALNDLLKVLLEAWMDQLALLRQETAQHNLDDVSCANIYVALDICHLMGKFIGTSAAVDAIQNILSSPRFKLLPYEARQLAWVQRFIYQAELLQQEASKSVSWRINQAILIQIFRKYMLEMSVESEMLCQVSRRIEISIAKNSIEDAVRDCLNPERRQLFTYNKTLELLRLCSAAIAGPDKAAFYASFTDLFTLSPEFSLSFSDIATHEWELLAARTSLRKCLSGAKTQHSQVLQALVAVELRLHNMKAISSLLNSEIQINPLLLEPWRLAVALEIMVGEISDERSQILADEIEKRQLVFTCNTFGDSQLLGGNRVSWRNSTKDTSLSLRGLGLKYVPTAVLLCKELISLDVSGNELLELPIGLQYLTNLQQLNASENTLLEFPAGIQSLVKLKELRLAHNNISTFSLPVLPRLKKIDIRWNRATQLPVSNIVALTNLKVFQAEENLFSMNDLSMISSLLSSREDVVSPKVVSKTPKSHAKERNKENKDDSAMEQLAHDNVTTSTFGEGTNQTRCSSNKTPSMTDSLHATLATTDDDGDQNMTREYTNSASISKNLGSETMMNPQKVSVTNKSKDNEDYIIVDDECDVLPISNEFPEYQSMGQDKPVLACDNSVMASTLVNSAAERATELQRVKLTDDNNDNTNTHDRHNVDVRNNLMTGSGEMNNISLNNIEVATSTVIREQFSLDAAKLAREKLATYMNVNRIDNRAEVRSRNPTLWREFLAANLPINLGLPACRMCFAPHHGTNQRLNSIVLCVNCLTEATMLLKERKEQCEGAGTNV